MAFLTIPPLCQNALAVRDEALESMRTTHTNLVNASRLRAAVVKSTHVFAGYHTNPDDLPMLSPQLQHLLRLMAKNLGKPPKKQSKQQTEKLRPDVAAHLEKLWTLPIA